MTRILLFSLIALFLLAASTIGVRADADTAWNSSQADNDAEALQALAPETAAGDIWRPGGALKLDAR